MDREHANEWGKLTDRGAKRRFQLVVVPAFDAVASWELFQIKPRAGHAAHDIIVTTWDQLHDSDKSKNPIERLKYPTPIEPSVHSTRIRIVEDDAISLVSALDNVDIPVDPGNHPIGTDGVLYHFELGDPFGGADWWETGPPAWSRLVNAVGKIHAALEHLAPSGAQNG